MESKHRQLIIGREHDRRHRALEPLGFVDRHVRDLVVLQELDRPFRVLLVEPAAVPKFDRDWEIQALPRLEDELACLGGRKDPLWKLDEHGTKLAGFDQRLERTAKLLIDRIEQLTRHVLAIDALLLDEL